MKTVRPSTKEGARSKVNYALAVVKRHVVTESNKILVSCMCMKVLNTLRD